MFDRDKLKKDALELLKGLIRIESFSKQEDKTAELLNRFFEDRGVPTHRKKNNVWAFNKNYDPNKPTILLNSHHDTVKPNPGYTNDPFDPIVKDGKLFGLGSNDAGGCLVSLMATFIHFYEKENLKYNFVVAATAEEEISGFDGLELVYPDLGPIDFAIVGEPTLMDIAVAEKGLMVLDCVAKGKAGHAAREEGDNAIYKALKDIEWIRNYKFEKVSPHLGPMKMSVTIINAGYQHNVVPENCTFTIDVRITEEYRNEDVLRIIEENIESEVKPRSVRLRPSFIDPEHPLVHAAIKYGAKPYGSPTTSDQALVPVPSVKMGPGNSGRSHTANEFIWLAEIEEGIDRYIAVLSELVI
ncbi:acetylornithine deacetylase [Sporocytophaga myxococcoides]|uniref:Acetylornithine deacetylase n=1 Tax=Sporocytophaga myxococcoides TaxID=153721 RepID=A0A098LBZ0_9BACT|nr:M20 family metallo-hydrolase [Sporocytophaga myxococcoides]GAL83942.1 acetylornithine deacetylase [Sporocytophaga myxococcoides]